MGLLDMLMKRGAGNNFTTGTVGPMGQAPQAPLNLQNPMPTMADINAQRPQKAMTGGAMMGAQKMPPTNMSAPTQPMSAGIGPDWAQGLLNKRQNYTAPVTPGGGSPFAFLHDLWSQQFGADNPLEKISLALGGILGGGQGGQSQGAAPAANPRPAPVQFDPQAYLQQRLGGIPPANMGSSYPAKIKLPF